MKVFLIFIKNRNQFMIFMENPWRLCALVAILFFATKTPRH